ncbi:MAG: hypothetical protein AAGE94_05035 [Acidobacteriota bacterium]
MSIHSRSHNAFRPFAHLRIASLALTLLIAGATTGTAQTPSTAGVYLFDDGEPVGTTLAVGTILEVGFDGLSAGQLYQVALLDEAGMPLSQQTAVADAKGEVAPFEIWRDVVGCDGDVVPDPAILRFERHEHAELGLAGRQLSLMAEDLATGAVVASVALDFDVTLPIARFFGADGTGCLRYRMTEGETLYLGGYHVGSETQPLSLFVAPHQTTWTVGDPIHEVRPDHARGPQAVPLPVGTASFLEIVWVGIPVGEYDLIIRRGPSTVPFLDPSDKMAADSSGLSNGTGAGLMAEPCWDCDEADEEESEGTEEASN